MKQYAYTSRCFHPLMIDMTRIRRDIYSLVTHNNAVHHGVCVRICRRDLKNLVYFVMNSSQAESSASKRRRTYVYAARCDLCLLPVLKVEVEVRCNGARFLCNDLFSIYRFLRGFLRHEAPAAILPCWQVVLPILSEGKDRTTEIGHG